MNLGAIAIALTLIVAAAGTYLADHFHQAAVLDAFKAGKAEAAAACMQSTQTKVSEAETRVRQQAALDIAASASAAQEHQQVRTVIETRFVKLKEEAAHAPVDDVDRCVLPPERLRRWSQANTDPTGAAAAPADRGASAGQPDAAPSAAARAEIGGDTRSGTEPPAGDRGLSPASGPALRPPQAPAGVSSCGVHPLDVC